MGRVTSAQKEPSLNGKEISWRCCCGKAGTSLEEIEIGDLGFEYDPMALWGMLWTEAEVHTIPNLLPTLTPQTLSWLSGSAQPQVLPVYPMKRLDSNSACCSESPQPPTPNRPIPSIQNERGCHIWTRVWGSVKPLLCACSIGLKFIWTTYSKPQKEQDDLIDWDMVFNQVLSTCPSWCGMSCVHTVNPLFASCLCLCLCCFCFCFCCFCFCFRCCCCNNMAWASSLWGDQTRQIEIDEFSRRPVEEKIGLFQALCSLKPLESAESGAILLVSGLSPRPVPECIRPDGSRWPVHEQLTPLLVVGLCLRRANVQVRPHSGCKCAQPKESHVAWSCNAQTKGDPHAEE